MSAWPEVGPTTAPRQQARIRGWAGAALLLIDVIHPLDFAGGDSLYASALPAARRIAALKGMLRREGVPAVYVNDNFGCWDLGPTTHICGAFG